VALPGDPDASPAWRSGRGQPARRWDVALVIAAGGVVGGLLRRSVNVLLPVDAGAFPWATLVENVTGCLLLAALMVYVTDVWPPNRYVRPFLGVGVLGAYTTFSTFTNEIRSLLDRGRPGVAFLYAGMSLLAGLTATYAGLWVARRVSGVPRQTRRAT